MSYIYIISWKELRSYLTSPIAYIITAVFIAISGTSFVSYLAATNYSDTRIRGFLDAGQFLVLIFAALLTMRLIAEEKKIGTWELMLSLPVNETELVIGKFLASLGLLTCMLVLTLYYPILLIVFGDPDPGPIISGYIGLFLLGSASFAIGIFASSLTSNQIVSAIVAGGILFGVWFLEFLSKLTPKPFSKLLSFLSLSTHFSGFIRGIIDTRDIIYFASVTAIFLFLTINSVKASRW